MTIADKEIEAVKTALKTEIDRECGHDTFLEFAHSDLARAAITALNTYRSSQAPAEDGLVQGLRETAKWIRAKDRNATIDIYCEQAADEILILRSRCDGMKTALDDAIATLAAVRATSRSDEWAGSADHFYQLCGETLARTALGEGKK